MDRNGEETYLDWAASTPMRAEAIEAMVAAAGEGYGNPTGAHHRARIARRIVDDARDQVADALGAEPSEIIFCGSGTEADNLAIFGAHRRALRERGASVVACSAVEHHAVLRPVEELDGVVLGVDGNGRLDLEQLRSIATEDLAVVSVMLANNESGIVQPLGEIRDILDSHAPHALLHTDAVQAFPWLDLTTWAAPADLISLSGHKFGGPKGVGILAVRGAAPIDAHIIGGGQEFELRSGTHNVAGAAAFGAAAAAMHAERDLVVRRVGALRDRLIAGLRAAVPELVESGVAAGGDRSHKVAGSAHVCFPDIESEALLFMLEREGIYASAASSCASGAQDPSHVLAAMGYDRDLAAGSLRLSLGFGTTEADVDRALEVIPKCIAQLQNASVGA